MRVLHVEAGKHLYGGALQVSYLTRELYKLGVKSFLACPPDAELFDVVDESVVQLPTTMKGDADIGLVFRLKKLIKQYQIDIIHLHSRRGADLFGLIAGKLAGIPVVISRRVDNKEAAWFAKAKYHAANKVITISEGIRKVLLEEGVCPAQVKTVLSAVDTNKYQPVEDKEWFKREFGLENETFVMAVLAQLIPRKGHKVLFGALKKIESNLINHKLLIFGKGPIEQELKAQVTELGLEKLVQFCGFRNDLNRVLPNLDLVVHPAFAEGLGVALLQASASGVPIIASRAGGIPEAVRNDQNGWLVDPKNIDQLTDKLNQVLFDTESLDEFKLRGRELAETEFSTQAMANGNLAVYKEVLNQGVKS